MTESEFEAIKSMVMQLPSALGVLHSGWDQGDRETFLQDLLTDVGIYRAQLFDDVHVDLNTATLKATERVLKLLTHLEQPTSDAEIVAILGSAVLALAEALGDDADAIHERAYMHYCAEIEGDDITTPVSIEHFLGGAS